MRELVIGYDHGLGRGRQGDAAILSAARRRARLRRRRRSAALDATRRADLVERDPDVDRARRSRARAARAWADRTRFRGTVVPGDQRGRALGYPTLNIELSVGAQTSPARRCIRRSRPNGARRFRRHDEPRRPSDLRRSRRATLEVHLFDVSGDWYGEAVSIELISPTSRHDRVRRRRRAGGAARPRRRRRPVSR